MRREIAAQFHFRCAYRQTQEAVSGMRFTVDHIIPEIFGGDSEAANLCLACWDCNLAKGQRIAATDPDTTQLAPLFHPHQQVWHDHFEWVEAGLRTAGKTASGRATVNALGLNREALMQARQLWIEVGWHPPDSQR